MDTSVPSSAPPPRAPTRRKDLTVSSDPAAHCGRCEHRHQVAKGETLAIVSESGSGKSVTSFAVMRILDRAGRIEGSVMFSGVDVQAATTIRCAICAAAKCR
jgi:ABC-type multidrug transport system fused ATPase/permease subunit